MSEEANDKVVVPIFEAGWTYLPHAKTILRDYTGLIAALAIAYAFLFEAGEVDLSEEETEDSYLYCRILLRHEKLLPMIGIVL